MRTVGNKILDTLDQRFQDATSPVVRINFLSQPEFTAQEYYRRLVTFARYLGKAGKGGGLEHAEYFGFPDEAVDVHDLVAQAWNSPHNFQLILSPGLEVAASVPLKALAQSWMLQVQADLRVGLSWAGCVHADEPDHPHVQILLVGRSRTGQPFRIAQQYWMRTMRARAAELVHKFGGSV